MLEHTPVLLHEVIRTLDPGPGKKYIDATLGMGGHAMALVREGARVLGIDADPTVIASVRAKQSQLTLAEGNFSDIQAIAEASGFTEVDGIFFDLGLGSHQLDDPKRGFSFQKEGPLDMRFDTSSNIADVLSARKIVNFYSEKDLIRIFYQNGEERRFGKKIARAVMMKRKEGTIDSTADLFEIIKSSQPGKLRFRAGDTARKIFQALRIEVNDELANIERGLKQAVGLLKTGGRLVVISFHSLEDRIVKKFFLQEARDCICPPSFPICVCAVRARLRILTKKPITARESELAQNPRARSAKLRAAELI